MCSKLSPSPDLEVVELGVQHACADLELFVSRTFWFCVCSDLEVALPSA